CVPAPGVDRSASLSSGAEQTGIRACFKPMTAFASFSSDSPDAPGRLYTIADARRSRTHAANSARDNGKCKNVSDAPGTYTLYTGNPSAEWSRTYTALPRSRTSSTY